MLGNAASAEGPGPKAHLKGERPDPPGTATMITVGVYLSDINSIDDARQEYSVDIFVKIEWNDPRLALPEDERSGQTRIFSLEDIWWPRGLIINDRGTSPQLPLVANIDPHGKVTYRQRRWGTLAADLKFQEFPFDSQRLEIDVAFYQYSPDEIGFSSDSGIMGDEGTFSAEGWRFRILEPTFGEARVPSQEIVRPRLTFAIEAVRNSDYYLLTMVLPMSLIVFMAWTAFWLQPNIVNPRLGISTAAIFSLIALGVSIRLGLPRISYLTRADWFAIGCTILVFLSLGVSVTVIRWGHGDQMGRALRLNRIGRWIYPLLFAGVVVFGLVL